MHICLAGGIVDPEVLAFPTGIMISGNQGRINERHGLKRISTSHIDLYTLERVNTFSRAYGAGQMTIEELNEALAELRSDHRKDPLLLRILYKGVTSAAFSLMLGGGFHELWISFLCVLVLAIVTQPIKKTSNATVMVNFIGGLIIPAVAILLTNLIGRGNLDVIIVAGIIPLLPGLATLNAVRDAMHGDLVSGNARLLKAILIAISLASGVGVTLAAYLSMGGAL